MPVPEPSPSAGTHRRLPVLWLCGAPATGKSVTAWELFQRHPDEQVAYVDIDQVKMLYPEIESRDDLGVRNLRHLVDVHEALGTRALIVSGVAEPGQMESVSADLAASCDLTWCLLDADDATLRTRVRERGWPDDLATQVVAEAAAWRAAGVTERLDTGVLSVEEAAGRADRLLRLAAVSDPRALADSAALHDAERDHEVVLIVGPRAVGKSTVAWGVFMDRVAAGEPTGFLDADQLGFIHADPGTRYEVILRAVTGVSAAFGAAGARRTIVNGNLPTAEISKFATARAVVIQLDASCEVLARRIESRRGGNQARLAGDDLGDASDQTRAAVLEAALTQRSALREASCPGHRVTVDDDDVAAHVAAVVNLLSP